MGTIKVALTTQNPSDVTVSLQSTGDGSLNETFTLTYAEPFDHEWTVDPGPYSIGFSWKDGFHNIDSDSLEGNYTVLVNGQPLTFQVAGYVVKVETDPLPDQMICARFGFNVD